MITVLHKWMRRTNAMQKESLAQIADTSVSYLYQIASGDRMASAGLAGRIERASEIIRRQAGNKELPPLPRHLISSDCKLCTYTPAGKR